MVAPASPQHRIVKHPANRTKNNFKFRTAKKSQQNIALERSAIKNIQKITKSLGRHYISHNYSKHFSVRPSQVATPSKEVVAKITELQGRMVLPYNIGHDQTMGFFLYSDGYFHKNDVICEYCGEISLASQMKYADETISLGMIAV